MQAQSISRILVIFTAVVVLAAGVWYARSTQEPTVQGNVITAGTNERQCPNQTESARIAAADLIVTGTVSVVLPEGSDALVYIKPQTIYKGDILTPFIIRAQTIDGVATGGSAKQQIVVLPDGTKDSELHFASEQPPYLLYLRKSGNKFLTSRCDGSRFLGTGLTAEEQASLTTPIVVD